MDKKNELPASHAEDSKEELCTIALLINLARETHEEFLSISRTLATALPIKRRKVKSLPKKQPVYLNSYQVMRLLNISSPTLKRYRSANIIKFAKINGSCKYLYSDVVMLLNKKIHLK